MNIHFEKVTGAHLDPIFKWLSEPHIMEFWDNTQEHKDDIVNFAEGRRRFIGDKFLSFDHFLHIFLLQVV
jgi:hypothetical protein